MKIALKLSFVAALVLGIGSVALFTKTSNAGSEEAALRKKVQAIADAVKKGDMKTAKSLASKLAKAEEEVYYVMLTMKPRKKKGFGVGEKAGDVIPDGIELKIRAMARDLMSSAKLKKETDALEEMAYRVVAIGLISDELPPTRDRGKKTKAAWLAHNKTMKEASMELIKAAKSGAPATVKKVAAKINSSCNNCHSIFR